MIYSQACVDLVKESEGYVYPPAPDPIGISTVYFGHETSPRETYLGTTADAEAYLASDLGKACSIVQAVATKTLGTGTLDGLTDFVFNVGPGKPNVKDGFVWLRNGKHSTVLTLLNDGDLSGAAYALLAWDHAGGVVLPGLLIRRQKERAMLLSDFS